MTRPRTRLRERRQSASRRSGKLPGRRFALVVTLVLVALTGSAGAALGDASSQPVVTATIYNASGTSPDSVTLGALQQDPRCQPYGAQSMRELGREGWVDVPLPPAGAQTGTWPLSTILTCLDKPVAPAAVSGITVMNADGTPQEDPGSQITRADLASPSDFGDSAESPVIEDLGSVIQYDRPWRGPSRNPADYDYLDEVQASDNGQAAPIAIEVFEGPLLSVTATASQTSVPVGASVGFQAAVSPTNQPGLAYSWNFDGAAANSSAAAPQATFNAAGQYNVTVQVTDAAGGGGGASVLITVGSPPSPGPGNHNQPGAGTSGGSHTPTGPRRSSGKHPGGRPGNTNSGGSGPPGSGQGAGSSNHAGPRSASSRPISAQSANAHLPRHRTPPAAARPAGERTPAGSGSSPPLVKPQPPIAPAQGPVVAGRLISDVIPVAPGASPLVTTSAGPAASAPPARRALRASAMPALAGGFAVLLVFMLGATRELRWRPLWRLARMDQLIVRR